MFIKKVLPYLLALTILAVVAWFYKAYKMVPSLPVYDHELINEQGNKIKISDLKGHYVLISYFQTWCGTCAKELPGIDALQMSIGKDKLSVLIVSDEPEEKILRFKERFCNTLDYYRTDKPLIDLGIRVFPTTYLLNKKGEVILSNLDAFDWNSEEVKKAIIDSER
ncbi:MAG: Redoxin domain protein [Bacteroidetes bacterium]|nr:Redoxin domain protein [Bacteroidota bacterium]